MSVRQKLDRGDFVLESVAHDTNSPRVESLRIDQQPGAAFGLASLKLKKFKSAILTGTGSVQTVAHGLGVVPQLVMVIPVNAAPSIVEGAHTDAALKLTVTASGTYYVVAFA